MSSTSNNTSLSSSSMPSSLGNMAPTNKEIPSPSGSWSETKSPLYISFPINTVMELTLLPHREVVRGLIYTTDEFSNSIVIKKTLSHSTITSEVRVINASVVVEKKTIQAGPIKTKKDTVLGSSVTAIGEASETTDLDAYTSDLSLPLPAVNTKSLEERERRAIRLAEESFAHINQKASPVGQAIFDRLVKACNEVVWRAESILVLNQIRVDPPYGKEDCKLLVESVGDAGGSLHEGSLERVKMIVAAATV